MSIAGHKTNTLKNVNFKKENRDHKKLLKQGENTGNELYYIKDTYSYYKMKILVMNSISYTFKIPILTAVV